MARAWMVWALVVCTACGGTAGDGGDGGADGGDDQRCVNDLECRDGVFCNGAEQCAPERAGADERGCAPGPAACLDSQTCEEASERCLSDCDTRPDADGDGHDAITCGGDDCDDADADRFPGNTEVCDMAGHDEDCDPSSLGPDADGDGVVPQTCCNTQADSTLLCGVDCRDDNAEVNPDATEVCNGVDDDCDGMLDHPQEDNDGDGHADVSCAGEAGTDCNDDDPTIYEGAPELCDQKDNDCSDGPVAGEDDDGDGLAALDSACVGGLGTLPKTDCDDSDGQVAPGMPERCNGADDNCDGTIDEEPAASMACGVVSGGAVACVSGACEIASCDGALASCDGEVANGCETDTDDDLSHCGRCGNVCFAGATCALGTCRPVHDASWATPGSGNDLGVVAMDVDSSGNVYFAAVLSAGRTIDMGSGPLSTPGGQGILVGSFDPAGNPRWGRVIADAAGNDDLAEEMDLAVDGSGNVYVVSSPNGTLDLDFGGGSSTAISDFFLVSYSASGAYRWEKHASSAGGGNTTCEAVEASGTHVYVACNFGGSVSVDRTALTSVGVGDILVGRWTTDGVKDYVEAVGGAGYERAYDLAIGEISDDGYIAGYLSGASVIGGQALDSSSGNDILVVSFDAFDGGAERAYNYGSQGAAHATAVAVDQSTREIYVGGVFTGSVDFGDGLRTASGTASDAVILRYNSNLFFIGSHHVEGSGADTIGAIHAANNVVTFAGTFTGDIDLDDGTLPLASRIASRGGRDVFVTQRDLRTAAPLWFRVFGSANDERSPRIAVGATGSVTLSGTFTGSLDLGAGPLSSPGMKSGFFVRLLP